MTILRLSPCTSENTAATAHESTPPSLRGLVVQVRHRLFPGSLNRADFVEGNLPPGMRQLSTLPARPRAARDARPCSGNTRWTGHRCCTNGASPQRLRSPLLSWQSQDQPGPKGDGTDPRSPTVWVLLLLHSKSPPTLPPISPSAISIVASAHAAVKDAARRSAVACGHA